MRKQLVVFLSIMTCLSTYTAGYIQSKKQDPPLKKASVGDMEKTLFECINKERRKKGLTALELSPKLTSLARKHSQDMASRDKLSHMSSSGNSYTDRLSEAGLLFRSNGENIAFSETFMAEFIHQEFMENPDHRKNILDPEFDKIGMGVIYKEDKGYYIAQNFLFSWESELKGPGKGEGQKDTPQELILSSGSFIIKLKQEAEAKINQMRREIALPPFVFLENASDLADQFSESKARELPLPSILEGLSEFPMIFHFVTAPSLKSALSKLDIFQKKYYTNGGIGIRFGTNKENPGGAYFFTFLFFLGDDYADLNQEELQGILLEKINLLRKGKGLSQIKLDSALSLEAEKISMQKEEKEEKVYERPSFLSGYRIYSYWTGDLLRIPGELIPSIINGGIKKFGAGVFYNVESEEPAENFWVTVIYK